MKADRVIGSVAWLAGLVGSVACGGSQPPPEPAPAPPPVAALPPAPVETQTSPAPATPEPAEAPPAPPPPEPVLKVTQGLATPESVLYDAAADRYLVSNINGKPLDVDNNGYIMVLSPEGTVVQEKFIAGGVKNVKLNAPKGMGISQGILYVTDITVVRKFDAKTGAPKGEIPVPGATFLNDITVGADGKVYVSDSDRSVVGQEPAGSDAVYVIEKDKPRAIAKGTELGGPNGLLSTAQGLLVVTGRSNELARLDEEGRRQDVTTLPEGGLDGLAQAGDTLLVSSWTGKAVYRGKLGGTFEPVLTGLQGPADIGFDTKRNRILVPRFLDDAVEVYALP